ncbi:MAG: hypothetical protein KGR26_13675, partial [Cyanobacteria bacterium REEB65]|nr:hypothetical protein [Cyanobacteria bacterium REEB65]
NVGKRLNSSALASVLTSGTWSCRILGQSKDVSLSVRCAWAMSASNPDLSPELARRSIEIHLDAKMERPWTRQNFKHNPLDGWVRENQAQLIWSFLVLVQNWLAEGQPQWAGKGIGSYFDWCAKIGGVLEAAGIAGFLKNLDASYDRMDRESAEWRALVAAWWERHGGTEVSAGELWELADRMNLVSTTLGSGNEKSQKIRLAKALLSKEGSVYGGYRVARNRDRHREVNLFFLDKHRQPVAAIVDSPAADGATGGQQEAVSSVVF